MSKHTVVRIIRSLLLVGFVLTVATGCKKKLATESSYCTETQNC